MRGMRNPGRGCNSLGCTIYGRSAIELHPRPGFRELGTHAPTYFAYKLRATAMSVVPLIIARPSAKMVIS